MINIIILCDETNENLGEYFNKCSNDFENYFKCTNLDCKNSKINSEKCKFYKIKNTVEKLDRDNFIFVVYSHGVEDAICYRGKRVITKDNELDIFNESLFYSTACSTGKELGPELIKKGTDTFWGYLDEIIVVLDYSELFSECENFGIKKFLEGYSIGDSFESAKNYITDQFFELQKTNTPAAVRLMEMRDRMTLLGNKTLTIKNYDN